MTTFKDLNLKTEIQNILQTLGFVTPTEIQRKAIPCLLQEQSIDFHGQAQTGTGKTLAFGLPLIQRIDTHKLCTQSLIVAPTRELVVQIYDSLRAIAQPLGITMAPIYGGMSMDQQMQILKKGVHIVIGTPGRLNDHLRRKTLKLDNLHILVLDEADIMLDMGFKDEVDEILTYAPKARQIWLFSATVKSGIKDIMKRHMKDTVSVVINKNQVAGTATKQFYCVIPSRQRLAALCRFINSAPDFYGFIFCQTKLLTAEVAQKLVDCGFNAAALHGDMSQAQRNTVIKKFKNKEYAILVATDVAARGIDVANTSHVINYSPPEDLESYVHRIGRTGRAGKEGIAITFTSKGDMRLLTNLKRKFSIDIQPVDLPSLDTIARARIDQAASHIKVLLEQQDTEPKRYQDQVLKLISSFTENQLRTLATQLMYDKFLASLAQEQEINYVPATQAKENDQEVQELFINAGLDDRLDKSDIVKLLTSTGILSESQISKIRIIKRRTFIEVPTKVVSQLLNALRNKKLGDQKVKIAVVRNN